MVLCNNVHLPREVDQLRRWVLLANVTASLLANRPS